MSIDLKRLLARWQSAGLIDARQVQAIADFESKSTPGPQPPSGAVDGSISATEVITYAGAVITLAGLATLLGTQYRQLGTVGRLAIPGLVTIAALLVTRALPGELARARRAQTSLITLAVASIGLFAFVLDIEFRYFQSSLGFAVSLVISGLALLGVALLLARLLPRLRRGQLQR